MVADGFDLETVLGGGGWDTRYAKVLLTQRVSETRAVAIVDTNGDGAELELEQWERTANGWGPAASSGVGPLDPRFGVVRGWTDGVAYAMGAAEPGETVRVPWLRAGVSAQANEHGVWVVAEEADVDAV